MKFLIFFLLFLLGTANGAESIANGVHSFQDLGSDFYESVPVKRNQGGELVLFNDELAKELGLDFPSERKQLEEKILSLFDIEVDYYGGDQEFMATRYQDSAEKGPGHAMGDGRALWLGEIEVVRKNGKKETLDVVIKGAGKTPLAWENHHEVSHKDGLFSLYESIHSYVVSNTLRKSGLQSTSDLAVIALPKFRQGRVGEEEQAALSIRVGQQMRLAHLRYHSDDPPSFKKMLSYIVKRELSLAKETVVTSSHVNDYLHLFAKNLAKQSANLYDKGVVLLSPTDGNVTTSGAIIDVGSTTFLDALHGDFSYLYDRIKYKDQSKNLEGYALRLFHYIESGDKEILPKGLNPDKIHEVFQEQYFAQLGSNFFDRLGLSEDEKKLIGHELGEKITKELHQLMTAQAPRGPVAMHDMRQSLFEVSQMLNDDDLDNQDRWNKALTPSSPQWNGNGQKEVNHFETHKRLRKYLSDLQQVIPDNEASHGNRTKKAQEFFNEFRTPYGPKQLNEFSGAVVDPVLQKIKDGESFTEVSKLAGELSEKVSGRKSTRVKLHKCFQSFSKIFRMN